MKVIDKLDELLKNENLIRKYLSTNFQQTFENFHSIFLSNKNSKIFIDDKMLTLLIKRDENIFECPLNIEPIIFKNGYINNKQDLLTFIETISKYLNKTIYFSLVYEDSQFYKLLKNDIYNYERLYTSICDYTTIDNIISKVLSSDNVLYSNRNVKKFEKHLEIKYYSKIDPSKMILDIEKESWKYLAKQDMYNKKDQLKYYSSLVKSGLATIAVSNFKNSNEIVSYRLEAIYNNKIHVLKNSFKEKYKKYSPGSYMLISDLYNKYNKYNYVDLFGGPSLAKNMIESNRVQRYDMLIGDDKIIKELERKRKDWDLKNYSNFLNKRSIKEIFSKKKNILAVTSCFGLGPVGKLSAIVETSKNDFNWYASGEEFDLNVFNDKNIFKEQCFTTDKNILKEFIKKHDIKYALVVLKNKMARLLIELGVKVIYVDSLPFMWSLEDANGGKVPYDVDCYCAQKTIELNKQSKEIFNSVKNLVWVDPIVNNNFKRSNKLNHDYVLINIGGLHSPSTDGCDYVDIVLKSIIEFFSNEKIIITTSFKTAKLLKNKLNMFNNVFVRTLKQSDFFDYINNSKLFITSPGLTTILESRQILDSIIFLPPQNISQFYNIEYGKKIFKYYKEITWNNDNLTLRGLTKHLDKDEHGVIEVINDNIKKLNNKSEIEIFKKYFKEILANDFVRNDKLDDVSFDGASQVVSCIKKIMEVDE